MPFTTFGQETEWASFLQPRSPHRAQATMRKGHATPWPWNSTLT